MKNLIFIFLTLTILASCKSQVRFIKNGIPQFNIAINSNSDSLTIEAANLLKTYLYKITGADVKVINNPEKDRKCLYLGKEIQNEASVVENISKLKDEGFMIDISHDRIILAGNGGRADRI